MRIHRIATVAVVTLVGLVVFAAVQPNWLWSQAVVPKDIGTFMRLKLEPAKLILEGIATEDYDLIARSAQQVQTLTLDEKWNVLQTEQYARNSQQFQRSVLLVLEAARKKNLDGAALSYVQMTLNCVHCHRDIRSSKKFQ